MSDVTIFMITTFYIGGSVVAVLGIWMCILQIIYPTDPISNFNRNIKIIIEMSKSERARRAESEGDDDKNKT